MTDAAETLAEFGCALDVSKHQPAMDAALLDVIDTLGCAAAASRSAGIAELGGLIDDWGGKAESTLWFRGRALPGPQAALYNGMLSHAVEYDDTHDRAVLHAGVTVIPAVMAAAERRGRLSGGELIAAVIVGVEVACRLALATRRGPGETGWLLTPLCGTFGAAAGAARALGLTTEQTVHAFGLAYAQVAGNGQATIDGGLAKRMQAGFAARSGLLGAVLADAGLTGARNVFEGARGYFKVYHGNEYDETALVDGLGQDFEICNLSYKPYPCCRWTHAALEAALLLRADGIAADAIERIEVKVNRQAFMSTGQPLAAKQVPANTVAAQFSIPYSVALALVNGSIGVGDFSEQAIRRPEIIEVARRVGVEASDDWATGLTRGVSPARLKVLFKDGSVRSAEILTPSGDGREPGIAALIRRKFVDCCIYGGISEARARVLLAGIEAMPTSPDAVPLIRHLANNTDTANHA